MSRWRLLVLDVSLATDLHCGNHALGFIAKTHYFVPSHIPWFSLIPAAADALRLHARPTIYEDLETLFQDCLRFTPFYVQGPEGPLFPWVERGKELLETRYIGSFHGIGIDYGERQAIENRLFEREVILRSPRNLPGAPGTVLRGGMFWKPGEVAGLALSGDGRLQDRPLIELLRCSQWGGERGKGLGTLARVEPSASADLFGLTTELEGQYPSLQGAHCPTHLLWREGLERQVSGILRPFSGRRHDPLRGSGQRPEACMLAYEPGWSWKGAPLAVELRSPRAGQLRPESTVSS